MNETNESRVIRANDAKVLLENKILQESFKAVGEHIDRVALSCDPDNKERAQRIILSKQILASIIREIERVIEDGEMAQVQISEIEKRSALRIFRR